jgi:hypothetical protein
MGVFTSLGSGHVQGGGLTFTQSTATPAGDRGHATAFQRKLGFAISILKQFGFIGLDLPFHTVGNPIVLVANKATTVVVDWIIFI